MDESHILLAEVNERERVYATGVLQSSCIYVGLARVLQVILLMFMPWILNGARLMEYGTRVSENVNSDSLYG